MYEMSDVDAAEKRIREEVPNAIVGRSDYGWSLTACASKDSVIFFVFHHTDRTIFRGDVDWIISQLRPAAA